MHKHTNVHHGSRRRPNEYRHGDSVSPPLGVFDWNPGEITLSQLWGAQFWNVTIYPKVALYPGCLGADKHNLPPIVNNPPGSGCD